MFSTIWKLWNDWFGKRDEDEQENLTPPLKRPWSLADEPVLHSSFPKRRRLICPDVLIGPRFKSDDFLCPARDFGTSNRMASNSIFYSMNAVHSGSQDGRGSAKTQAAKENIISISDDDEEVAETFVQKKEAKMKSHNPYQEKEAKRWFTPKPFTKREHFLNQNKLSSLQPPAENESESDIQVVKMVEPKSVGVPQRDFLPFRRVGMMERRRENQLQSRFNFGPLKAKSSPHLSLSTEKILPRKLSVNESFRLEEKKKYSELLQKFTRVPVASPVAPLQSSFSVEKAKRGLLNNSRSSCPKIVECIDLTKGKERVRDVDSNQSDIEILDDRRDCSLMSRMEEEKLEHANVVIKKTKEHPLYDPRWTSDLTLIYDHKRLQRRRKEEQEKLKVTLCSRRSKEILQDFLEEQIQTHMRITEVALPEEIISLEDEELKLPKLTTQMERMVNSAFQRGNPGEVLVVGFSLSITRRDIFTLSSSNWLNDEVINFYMNLLIERGKEGKYPSMYGFNTFFYPKLLQSGHSSLKRWTRKIDIFSYNLIIVPVHLGVHWCMAAIDHRKKSIKYFDSMGAPNRTCLEALIKYLEDEMMDKKRQRFDRTGWTVENVQNIPQQMNGSDCGMFACMYAEFLCRDAKINFSQADMPYFRRKMAYEILSKKLLL